MQLPPSLQQAIESFAEKEGSLKGLQAAHQGMSHRYREGGNSSVAFNNPSQLISYLIARFPATFAVCAKVFASIRTQLPHFACRSLLDLGAGPGSATWAALQVFEELQNLQLIERETKAILAGRALGLAGDHVAWERVDLEQDFQVPMADLAVFSYSLGELQHPERALDRVWNRGIPMIAIIEPGTPQGFQKILRWREQWIQKGAELIVPCPHRLGCPMQGSNWCHFAARVERSRLHRQIKGGSLGYEDEKYSYIVLGQPGTLENKGIGRVVTPPTLSKGQVRFTLCHEGGTLKEIHVTRSNKALYREAKKVEWGSPWN